MRISKINNLNIFHLQSRTSKTYIEQYVMHLAAIGKNKANNRKRKRYAKMRS